MRSRGLVLLISSLATLSLAGQGIFEYVHLASVPHVVCVEHGELHHPDGDHGSRGADRREVDAAAYSSSQSTNHDHGHCPLCPSNRERLRVVGEPVAVGATAVVARNVLDSAERLLRWPTFRNAPKQSPPA